MTTYVRAGTRFFLQFFLAFAVSRVPAALAADALEDRPLLAIWRDFDGNSSYSPNLRIAVWNDGRIVFAKDPNKWSHELMQGRIDAARIAELKKAIVGAGAFELKGYCYLVPDAPVDCMMLDFGDKRQMMYWDEVEALNYGINTSPKPQRSKFKFCWKKVNRLALEAITKEWQRYSERFERPPKSWRMKEQIQSE